MLIKLDPHSSAVQAEYLVKAFKSTPFVIFHAYSMSTPALLSVIKALGTHHKIRIDEDLPETILNSVIPQLPTNVLLSLNEHMKPETIVSIAQLLPQNAHVEFVSNNVNPTTTNLAVNLATHMNAGRYIHVGHYTSVGLAQVLAGHVRTGVVLYSDSNNEAYIRAIANALQPGNLLVLHQNTTFTHRLTAIRYLRPGTVIDLGDELDDHQIDLIAKNITKDVGYTAANQEIINKLHSKLNAKDLVSTTTSTPKIDSFFSYLNVEKQRTANEKMTRFFSEQFQTDGPFQNNLDHICQGTDLKPIEVLQYFIAQFDGETYETNALLEANVLERGFHILVYFEDELQTITNMQDISKLYIDNGKKMLVNQLKNLTTCVAIEESMNTIGID